MVYRGVDDLRVETVLVPPPLGELLSKWLFAESVLLTSRKFITARFDRLRFGHETGRDRSRWITGQKMKIRDCVWVCIIIPA